MCFRPGLQLFESTGSWSVRATTGEEGVTEFLYWTCHPLAHRCCVSVSLWLQGRAASRADISFSYCFILHSFAKPLQLQEGIGFCPSPHGISIALLSSSALFPPLVMSELFKLLFWISNHIWTCQKSKIYRILKNCIELQNKTYWHFWDSIIIGVLFSASL